MIYFNGLHYKGRNSIIQRFKKTHGVKEESMEKGICLWHNKELVDVTEWEMDSCGGNCVNCEDLVLKSEEVVDE